MTGNMLKQFPRTSPPTLCFVVAEGFDIICLYLQHLSEHLWLRLSDALAPHSPCIYTFSILRCNICLFLRLKKRQTCMLMTQNSFHIIWHGMVLRQWSLIIIIQDLFIPINISCTLDNESGNHVLFGYVILFALRLLVILLFLVIFWQQFIQPE